jgi:hypothetical protein
MTYDELELQLWRTEFQLAQANSVLAQMVMKDLMPKMQQREAELAKEKPDGQ